MKKINKQYYKVRGMRLSDKTWEEFQKKKPRGVSWESLIKKINKKI